MHPRGGKTTTGHGEFHLDATLSYEAPATANCGGVPREYRLTFTGRIETKKGKPHLLLEADDLEADEPACPDMRCRFKRTYDLSRK